MQPQHTLSAVELDEPELLTAAQAWAYTVELAVACKAVCIFLPCCPLFPVTWAPVLPEVAAAELGSWYLILPVSGLALGIICGICHK